MSSNSCRLAQRVMRNGSTRVCIGIVVALLVAKLQAQNANASRLKSAAGYLSSGHLELAESELQKVLQLSPNEYRALDLLGVVRVLQQRPAEAESLFQRSIESKKDFASAHAHLGLLYLQSVREAEAVTELRQAIRLDPSRNDVSDALVHILRQEGEKANNVDDFKAALGFFIEARKLAPKNADVQFEFAMTALQMSLMQDAIGGFRQTLSLRKHDALAIYGLGRAYGELGRLEDARIQFTHYIALRPDDPSGYCSLGMTLAALDRRDEARSQFEQSIAAAPSQTEAYFQLGMLEVRANNGEAASTAFGHVLDRDPKHAGALTGLGRLAFQQKHYAEAIDLLKRAIAAQSSLREAHYYLAMSYAHMGQKTEADEEFQRSTALEREEVEKRRRVWNRLELPAN